MLDQFTNPNVMSDTVGLCVWTLQGAAWIVSVLGQFIKDTLALNYRLVSAVGRAIFDSLVVLCALLASVWFAVADVVRYIIDGSVFLLSLLFQLIYFTFQCFLLFWQILFNIVTYIAAGVVYVLGAMVCICRDACASILSSCSIDHVRCALSSCWLNLLTWGASLSDCITTFFSIACANIAQLTNYVLQYPIHLYDYSVHSIGVAFSGISSAVLNLFNSICMWRNHLVRAAHNSILLQVTWKHFGIFVGITVCIALLLSIILLVRRNRRHRNSQQVRYPRHIITGATDFSDDEFERQNGISFRDMMRQLDLEDDEFDDTNSVEFSTDGNEDDRDGNSIDTTTVDDSDEDTTDTVSDVSDISIHLPPPVPLTAATATNRGSAASQLEHYSDHFEDQLERTLCVVCRDQTKSVLLLPCRHMCLCVDCAHTYIGGTVNGLRRRTCPLCRSNIETVMNVYM